MLLMMLMLPWFALACEFCCGYSLPAVEILIVLPEAVAPYQFRYQLRFVIQAFNL